MKTRKEIAVAGDISVSTVRWRMSQLEIKPTEYSGEQGINYAARYSDSDVEKCLNFPGKRKGLKEDE